MTADAAPLLNADCFPHLLTSTIEACSPSQLLVFRGVSRRCRWEVDRIVSRQALVANYNGVFRTFNEATGTREAVPPSEEWMIQAVTVYTALYVRAPTRLLLAHTVRYFEPNDWVHPFFPPNLRTVVIDLRCEGDMRAGSTRHLLKRPAAQGEVMKWVHLIESGESTFTSPNITKVVLHLSTGVDTVVPGFSFKARVWWNRLFEPIVAAPETVTDVVVEFSYPAVGPHAREHVSRHINAYWFNLTRVLKNSKVQNVMLINVASVHPDTEEPANPDTFAVPHQNIAKELRDSGLSHVQVMSRDEYKTQVGDKQFKLEF